MIDLLSVERIYVPQRVADATQATLREAGRKGFEAFVLWVGVIEGLEFEVTGAVTPAQRALRTSEGVSVHVDGAELHRLNVWLYENNLRLVAQVHSHPTDAFHSETDDAFAIATVAGSLSIVVPHFAEACFDLRECAVFRLVGTGEWQPLASVDVATLIHVRE
jgi:hypothetical protein